MTISLPDCTSPALRLVQPTRDEILQQCRHNSASWKGALTQEAYMRREKYLQEQSLSKDSGLTSWALVDTSCSPDKRVVLSGCETLRKKALVSRNGKVEEVIVHGVGSVFTPPNYRKRGYGVRMIQELGKTLKTWQIDHGTSLFSILYSDIGKKYYAVNGGWHPHPSAHIHLPPQVSGLTGVVAGSKIKLLFAEDLAALCARDEAQVRRKITRHNGLAVAIVPDVETIQWHHAREEFVGNEHLGRKPTVKGALVAAGKDTVWCIWSRVWYNPDKSQSKGNTMYILRLVVESDDLDESEDDQPEHIDAIASLLRLAQEQAVEWHMSEVELWNPQPRTLAAAAKVHPEVAVVHREEESIAALKWYGDEDETTVTWLENEKYAWC